MTAKEKLDKALGISDGKSMDDFLEDLDIQSNVPQETVSKIEDTIKDTITNIDQSLNELNDPKNIENIEMANEIQKSLNDINELVDLSKKIINHLYTDIVGSELVDSELIASTASFIQATHDNIKEYIELYRDRLKFFDSLKLEMVRHQHRKDEMQLKHELDMKKLQARNPINADPENMKSYSQEAIVEAIKKAELMGEEF